MSADNQYYTFVESEKHFNYIVAYFKEKGFRPLSLSPTVRQRLEKNDLVIFYPCDHAPETYHHLQQGTLTFATEELPHYKRVDLFVNTVPDELFEL